MTDLLRRSMAPLSEIMWKEIDSTAARILKSQLTARTFVDFNGPHGWDLAAVNLGRLDTSDISTPYQVPWGIRLVQPLLEVRMPFQIDQMELDSIGRGAKDADLDQLEDVARRIALFEESAIYNGFEPAGIKGILASTAHEPIRLPENPREFPKAVAQATQAITLAGVEGPLILILGCEDWSALMQSGSNGYPPQRIIRQLVHKVALMSPAIQGGLVLSAAKGNFELTVGQDFSVGYAFHDRDQVEFYLTESFTFRVLEPKAAVRLTRA